MPKKRQFIDKKNAITFHIVHRSQRDPLQADDDAPSHVLVPTVHSNDKAAPNKRREELRKFGVFYDDDYNYMQHLYDLDEVKPASVERFSNVFDDICILDDEEKSDVKTTTSETLNLPSSVFPSEFETNVGLLNKAVRIRGPQPDWDPDIVAAMDDDFDMDETENVLDDDFMAAANANVDQDDSAMDADDSDVDSLDGERSDSEDGSEKGFMKEETKSRFTAYSMTSSVIRRNAGLTLLDDRFEQLFEDYSDTEIGALDHDDIEGGVTTDDALIQHALQEYEDSLAKRKNDFDPDGTKLEGVDSGTESDEAMEKLVIEKQDEKWDCESILSTYSNLYNHPRLIEGPNPTNKIELTSRLGIPRDTLPQMGLTRKQVENEIRESRRADRASTYRPRGETPAEKYARKQAIKAERKDRRIEKKSNKMAFKEEELLQNRQKMNVITNIQGVKIT